MCPAPGGSQNGKVTFPGATASPGFETLISHSSANAGKFGLKTTANDRQGDGVRVPAFGYHGCYGKSVGNDVGGNESALRFTVIPSFGSIIEDPGNDRYRVHVQQCADHRPNGAAGIGDYCQDCLASQKSELGKYLLLMTCAVLEPFLFVGVDVEQPIPQNVPQPKFELG